MDNEKNPEEPTYPCVVDRGYVAIPPQLRALCEDGVYLVPVDNFIYGAPSRIGAGMRGDGWLPVPNELLELFRIRDQAVVTELQGAIALWNPEDVGRPLIHKYPRLRPGNYTYEVDHGRVMLDPPMLNNYAAGTVFAPAYEHILGYPTHYGARPDAQGGLAIPQQLLDAYRIRDSVVLAPLGFLTQFWRPDVLETVHRQASHVLFDALDKGILSEIKIDGLGLEGSATIKKLRRPGQEDATRKNN